MALPAPTYATAADYADWLLEVGGAAPDADPLAGALVRAERDIDMLLGAWIPLDGGLKLDPAELEPWEATGLSRATCAQAQWLLAGGGQGTVPAAAGLKRVKGPDFEKEYFQGADAQAVASRIYGPRVRSEMAAIAHLRLMTARATA